MNNKCPWCGRSRQHAEVEIIGSAVTSTCQHEFHGVTSSPRATFEAAARETLLGLNLGYKFQMSDYAGSREAEAEYERQGLAEIDNALAAIMAAVDRYVGEVIGDDIRHVDCLINDEGVVDLPQNCTCGASETNELRAQQRRRAGGGES